MDGVELLTLEEGVGRGDLEAVFGGLGERGRLRHGNELGLLVHDRAHLGVCRARRLPAGERREHRVAHGRHERRKEAKDDKGSERDGRNAQPAAPAPPTAARKLGERPARVPASGACRACAPAAHVAHLRHVAVLLRSLPALMVALLHMRLPACRLQLLV